ncbi:hypothetical protein AR457_40025 [Streptomyces agglomeratus]|nr:hypothetical protein AR457_40025 [Streptomyces agglomeratus]OEJ36917.1 hypothetical protein BGK70_00680 [Streptomyces agglomeratus]
MSSKPIAGVQGAWPIRPETGTSSRGPGPKFSAVSSSVKELRAAVTWLVLTPRVAARKVVAIGGSSPPYLAATAVAPGAWLAGSCCPAASRPRRYARALSVPPGTARAGREASSRRCSRAAARMSSERSRTVRRAHTSSGDMTAGCTIGMLFSPSGASKLVPRKSVITAAGSSQGGMTSRSASGR